MFTNGLYSASIRAFRHLFSAFCLPGTVLGARNTKMGGSPLGASRGSLSRRRQWLCEDFSVLERCPATASVSQLWWYGFWENFHTSIYLIENSAFKKKTKPGLFLLKIGNILPYPITIVIVIFPDLLDMFYYLFYILVYVACYQ